ncbi:L,D-transpeptidase family protein [Flavisphingomonas formosensis]|uniref:L,D-transpeptidase family protein n=1 Tax=Flavisphingomonas formosensis TaxID=861534 RepID=UPI0018E0269D|nr:L,D-transpeptidase family protein [Sphingomonas formosensis]
MKWLVPCLSAIMISGATAPAQQPRGALGEVYTAEGMPRWTRGEAARLVEWLKSSADDGLAPTAAKAADVEVAMAQARESDLDAVATKAAMELVEAYRHGCCHRASRVAWHISDGSQWPDSQLSVANAVRDGNIDRLFATTRPSHPFYMLLRRAYAKETDPVRKAVLSVNLDRWRWMPRSLGDIYILVNAAAFEATMWRGADLVGRWKIVVGKTRSPTPVFRADILGVTLNPWWEIPPAIAREGIAAMVRAHPAAAAAQGYVYQQGHYRQRPGPRNALGRMKLVMPNRYNVYLHDTPAKSLFEKDVRAFSHGCVRVGDALGLASALLSDRGWNRDRLEATVNTGATVTVSLATAIPVYVAYFTAEPADDGSIRYLPDVYHRDGAGGGVEQGCAL